MFKAVGWGVNEARWAKGWLCAPSEENVIAVPRRSEKIFSKIKGALMSNKFEDFVHFNYSIFDDGHPDRERADRNLKAALQGGIRQLRVMYSSAGTYPIDSLAEQMKQFSDTFSALAKELGLNTKDFQFSFAYRLGVYQPEDEIKALIPEYAKFWSQQKQDIIFKKMIIEVPNSFWPTRQTKSYLFGFFEMANDLKKNKVIDSFAVAVTEWEGHRGDSLPRYNPQFQSMVDFFKESQHQEWFKGLNFLEMPFNPAEVTAASPIPGFGVEDAGATKSFVDFVAGLRLPIRIFRPMHCVLSPDTTFHLFSDEASLKLNPDMESATGIFDLMEEAITMENDFGGDLQRCRGFAEYLDAGKDLNSSLPRYMVEDTDQELNNFAEAGPDQKDFADRYRQARDTYLAAYQTLLKFNNAQYGAKVGQILDQGASFPSGTKLEQKVLSWYTALPFVQAVYLKQDDFAEVKNCKPLVDLSSDQAQKILEVFFKESGLDPGADNPMLKRRRRD